MMKTNNDEIQFVSTQRSQQKLVYGRQCYTLKRKKCGMRGCRGKLYTDLRATQVIQISEHADGCRVDPQTLYHQSQLNELRRLAVEDLRPLTEAYDELASNASTSLDTATYFPTWD
ncbi:hypothetical protein T07_347 [Trichinella nelsoni]|uniref:FLYWCH-type domain-containing protein n=1 Tax=Trichinella nelsoni TaxID=6336 RepID=A0A0V0S100_9BILA|nr:hypothetical protein T07_347 [Trichinella nelsoni]